MISYIAKLVAHLVLWFIMYASNKSRDRNFGPADPKLAAAAGMQDKTESVKENPCVKCSRSASPTFRLTPPRFSGTSATYSRPCAASYDARS